MDLNYNHLHYFWLTASHESLRAAAEELRLSRSAVSVQISSLEKSLGAKLLRRQGHRMLLTPAGRLVFTHADRMFTESRAMQQHFRAEQTDSPLPLRVGISGVLPKLSTYHILRRVQQPGHNVQLICREARTAFLVDELLAHRLDIVLSDIEFTPAKRSYRSHLIETSPVAVFGSPELAELYHPGFPESLNNAPLVLPTHDVALRVALDRWLSERHIRPTVVAELDDSALVKIFAEKGTGLFVAPTSIESELTSRYNVQPLGILDSLTTSIFALTADQDSPHPALKLLLTPSP